MMSKAAEAYTQKGVEMVEGDLDDRKSLERAFMVLEEAIYPENRY